MIEKLINSGPSASSRAPVQNGQKSDVSSSETPQTDNSEMSEERLDDRDLEMWLQEFQQAHGRAPRILHIGNIANNAYLNAKILNERGFDCDVICYDYYHIMGCPEWEEANIITTNIDHFNPKWFEVDLGGFERPKWFVQGPHQICLDYLLARRSGKVKKATTLWDNLVGYWSGMKVADEERRRTLHPVRAVAKYLIPDVRNREKVKARIIQAKALARYPLKRSVQAVAIAGTSTGRYVRDTFKGKQTPIEDLCSKCSGMARSTFVKTQHYMFEALDKTGGSAFIGRCSKNVRALVTWYGSRPLTLKLVLALPLFPVAVIILIFALLRSLWRSIEHIATKCERALARQEKRTIFGIGADKLRSSVQWYRSQGIVWKVVLAVPFLPIWLFALFMSLIRPLPRRVAPKEIEQVAIPRVEKPKVEIPLNVTRLKRRAAEMATEQKRFFSEREDIISFNDVVGYASTIDKWSSVFDHYDLIVGYSTDGILPLLCEKRPYLAFEHGTIRSIPFEKTTQGRLCALTYRSADRTLITNCDNIDAAKRLELDNYCFIPHPVNEDVKIGEAATDLRSQLHQEYDTDFVVFHPARQHWEEARHPSWEKGNDILIRGFADFVHTCCPSALAVFVEWGATVDATKELLVECDIVDRVKWIPPLPNIGMIEYILASDVVADQFYLGAFGSLTPKALLHGRPVLLKLDEDRHRWCFPEMPPILNTGTPEQAKHHLERLYQDPTYNQELCRAGKQWYEMYHSNGEIARVMGSQAAAVLKMS